MRARTRAVVFGAVAILVGQVSGTSATRAQSVGGRGSLGGYGGSMSNLDSGVGMGGANIPYAGRFGGFMPSRMSGGSLSFQARGTSAMGSMRTSFSLSPLSGGMSSMGGGSIRGLGTGGVSSFGTGSAMGSGGGMRQMTGAGGSGVMPPSFGYPFRQPPSLFAAPSGGTGMSM